MTEGERESGAKYPTTIEAFDDAVANLQEAVHPIRKLAEESGDDDVTITDEQAAKISQACIESKHEMRELHDLAERVRTDPNLLAKLSAEKRATLRNNDNFLAELNAVLGALATDLEEDGYPEHAQRIREA